MEFIGVQLVWSLALGVVVACLLALGLLRLVVAVRENLASRLAEMFRCWLSETWVKPRGERIPVLIRVQIPRIGRAPPRDATGYVDPLRPTWPDERE